MNLSDALHVGDCIALAKQVPPATIDLVCADPPYNIGFDYGVGEYKDNLPPEQYQAWSESWMGEMHRILKPHGAFWLIIGDEWAAELKVTARQIGFHMRSWVVWYYTFGVNSKFKFTPSHAHLFYFTKHKTEFVFNQDAIRIPSARSLVYNDKRASPSGRLPDDTWIIRPQDLIDGFPPDGDVWSIPRIAGTFHQREAGAPNQMPEQLIGRIIRACSNQGDIVLDPMAGTGTTLVVAKKLGRRYLGFELSPNFAGKIEQRLQRAVFNAPLDGPIPGT